MFRSIFLGIVGVICYLLAQFSSVATLDNYSSIQAVLQESRQSTSRSMVVGNAQKLKSITLSATGQHSATVIFIHVMLGINIPHTISPDWEFLVAYSDIAVLDIFLTGSWRHRSWVETCGGYVQRRTSVISCEMGPPSLVCAQIFIFTRTQY